MARRRKTWLFEMLLPPEHRSSLPIPKKPIDTIGPAKPA
jgi:hypothetical protein